MNTEIRDWLISISNDDMRALGCLYDAISVRVFNYIKTIVSGKENAEDILHDVFLQIYQEAGRIAKAGNPMGYIMTMARNRAYNDLKRKKKTPPDAAFIPVTAEQTEKIHNRIILDQAMKLLPTAQREAVFLHLICGFSHSETANIQGVPLVTAKWRYSKAIQKLSEHFKNEGEIFNETF